MMCPSHHMVQNKVDNIKDLYLNDDMFGTVRPEPRVMEVHDNKREPGHCSPDYDYSR
jgi:hypothetical protein